MININQKMIMICLKLMMIKNIYAQIQKHTNSMSMIRKIITQFKIKIFNINKKNMTQCNIKFIIIMNLFKNLENLIYSLI